jgi:hypothetical protein
LSFQIFSQQSKGAKDAQFHSRDRNAECRGNFFLWPFLNNRENCRNAQAIRQSRERLRGFAANVGGNAGIGRGIRRKIGKSLVSKLNFGPPRAEPVERCSRGNATGPGLESAFGLETRVSAMDTPERLDREIFSGCRIADDAQDPAINGPLMRAEERFECVEVTLLKEIQHAARTFRHPSSLSD